MNHHQTELANTQVGYSFPAFSCPDDLEKGLTRHISTLLDPSQGSRQLAQALFNLETFLGKLWTRDNIVGDLYRASIHNGSSKFATSS